MGFYRKWHLASHATNCVSNMPVQYFGYAHRLTASYIKQQIDTAQRKVKKPVCNITANETGLVAPTK